MSTPTRPSSTAPHPSSPRPLSWCVLAAAVLLALPAAAGVTGQPSPVAPAPASDDGWWFHSTSYGWLTAQDGDMHIGTLAVPVHLSLGDTISSVDEIDMAFMGGLEAGRGRWSIGIDLTYAKISDDFGGGGPFKSFRLEQTQWMINPFVTYQLVKADRWRLDGILGARINVFEMDVTGRFSKGGQVKVGGSRDWADPLVGLRGSWDASDRLTIGFRGDIGGFGVSSDLTWQAYVGLGWKMTRSTTLALGYRALGTDYSRDGFGSNIVSHGPLIGLQFTF